MSKWLRTAELNKGLIIALVVLFVGAGAFWGIKCSGSKTEMKKAALSQGSYYVTCSECGTLPEKASADEVQKMKDDAKGALVKCPKCGKYTAKFGRLRTDIKKTTDKDSEP
jgi:ribosomal protein S27E